MRLLFSSPKFAWLWLLVRVYLGYQWLTAGREKLTSQGWMTTGSSLQAFWQRAVAAPAGGTKGIVHYGWYHDLLQYMLTQHRYVWFAKLVAFVGVVAFLSGFMSFNYMLAGSASTNPVLLVLAILLFLAWKIAGYYGLDYVLLPRIGVPWQNRGLFDKARTGGEEPIT